LGLHDALDCGSVEGVNNGLSFGDIKLGLTVGIGSGDGQRVG
jgi:hypothetical protein